MDWTETWTGYELRVDDPVTFAPGARVLDCGSGPGGDLRAWTARGCRPIGLDHDWKSVKRLAAEGLVVVVGEAERLPFRSASFDGAICRAVLPYTNEAQAMAEIARVLRPAGEIELTAPGLGYYVAYLLHSHRLKRRIYALRTILNTWLYALTHWPRFFGDTIYQSTSRLLGYCARSGLQVVRLSCSRMFIGAPIFIYVRARKLEVQG